jgi:Rod binding domain-containing protein
MSSGFIKLTPQQLDERIAAAFSSGRAAGVAEERAKAIKMLRTMSERCKDLANDNIEPRDNANAWCNYAGAADRLERGEHMETNASTPETPSK